MKTKKTYGLKCSYYTKTFDTLDELLNDIVASGMDPNYKITIKGNTIGETAESIIENLRF